MNAAVLQAREPSARYLVELQSPVVRSFDPLATAPQGVAKLRELILSLAVQGKLVAQDSNEEPAALALKRAGLERDDRNIKRLSAISAATDSMANRRRLPRGWLAVPLGQLISSIKSGGTPSKQNPAYWNGDIPWASVKDLKFGEPIRDTQDKITCLGLAEGAALAEKGSIIICTRMGLGKIGEATRDIAINQDLKAVRLLSCIRNAYFINYFRTLSIIGSGMTVAGIKQDELLSLIVPLPPLAEQARIVARVEELMKLCDALEESGRLEAEQHARLVSTLFDALAASETAQALTENWQRITQHFDLLLDRPEAIDALEQTILQLAVRGLLVSQNPSDEPADALLSRIRADRDQLIAAGRMRRDKPLPPVSVAEQRLALPSGWIWVRMQHISDARLGKMLDKAKNTGQLCPYLRNTNVQWRRFELDDIKQIRLEPHELDEFRLLPGDLLICEGGEPGRCAIWRNESLEMYFQKALHRVRPLGGVLPEFLELCLQSDAAAGLLDQYFTGATIKHFAGQELSRYVLPLPPAKEQHRIVARVQQLRALCAQLRERLQQARHTQGLLADTLANTAVNA
ncbi:MAG: restriction endonuclease subunit S [Polaromonas sp.]